MALPNFLICFPGVLKSSVQVCVLCLREQRAQCCVCPALRAFLNMDCVRITGFSGGGALLWNQEVGEMLSFLRLCHAVWSRKDTEFYF